MKTKHFAFCVLQFALLLTTIPMSAQLPTAERSSATLVYRMTRDDMRALYIKEEPVSEKVLHTFVTSYRGDEIPRLERGNYLLVRAVNGQMSYKEYTEDNFEEAILLDDAKPQIVLLDTLRGFITDARIEGWKYNARSNSYVASKIKNEKVYEIDNNSVYHYIKGSSYRYAEPSWLARQWEAIKSWFRTKEDKYEGFIAFSKPKYKPNEKVRLKAYLTKNDKLYDKGVDLVLQRGIDMGGDTVLMHLAPYRKGMYEMEFELSENLKLRLDNSYGIILRGKDKKVFLSSYFQYEEYELKSLQFTAKMSKTKYSASDSVEVVVKAVDENGLGIYDGRVEIVVKPNTFDESLLIEQVFVPDTLYSDKIDMEGFAEKTLTIPNSYFPDGFSGSYSVRCVFLTADNERRDVNTTFKRVGYDIPVEKSETAPTAMFVREDGQIKLSFENPDSLPIWYSAYEGKKLLEQGYGMTIERNYTEKEKSYSLEYRYYSVEEDHIIEGSNVSLPYEEANITMNITAPKTIYPGQEVEIGVDVTDRKGRAVEGVDITAYSYTSKFANTGYVRPVTLRFNGVSDYTSPDMNYDASIDDISYSVISKLDWKIWRERLGLDSLEFYRFLSPAPLYKYTEDIESERVVILPFVVVDGEAVGVQVLYIDQQPIYLKAAEQRDVYAFDIASGHHTLRFRLPDREVTYLGNFERGKRVILSLDGSKSDVAHNIAVKKMPRKQRGKLGKKEIENLNPYMVLMESAVPISEFFGERMPQNLEEPHYTKNGTMLYDLYGKYYGGGNGGVRVGPFPYMGRGYVDVMRGDSLRINWFNVYGAMFEYRIDGHQVMITERKDSAIPKVLQKYRPSFDLSINPLTEKQLNDEYDERIKDRLANYPSAVNNYTDSVRRNVGRTDCRLVVLTGKEKGKDIHLRPMLYQFISGRDTLLYGGSTVAVRFYGLAEGNVTMRVIMRDGRQYVKTIALQKGGMNYVSLDGVELLPADDVSENVYLSIRNSFSRSLREVNFNAPFVVNTLTGFRRGSERYTDYFYVMTDSRTRGAEAEFALIEEASPLLSNAVIMVRGTTTTMSLSNNPLIIVDGDVTSSIRHNFSDDAFWQPRLTTDKEGHTSFTTTFPDDITQWTGQFIAVGTPKQTATQTIHINSYLPLSARLSIPNFAIRGDRFNAIGRLTSYSDDSVKVVTPYGEVTFAKSYTTDIEATAGDTDSLTLEYSLMREDGFTDGERRTLPIYPVGTMESKGEFVILENGAEHTFTAESEDVPVTIHAEATELGSLLEEIERTVNYVYSCNEQMASKVKALLFERKICEALGRKFDEKSDKELRKLISQILKNRNDEGFWGWWGVSNTEWWISAHIIEALVKAQKAGYEIDWNTEEMSMALMIALRGGDAKLSDRVLVMLRVLGAEADYETLFKALPALSKEPTIRERLARLETKAVLGLATPKDVEEIMTMSTETMLGGLSWSEKPSSATKRYFIPSPDYTTTENTLSAYRTLQHIEGTDSLRIKIRLYLFEQRRIEGWGNTYSTSRTIETMLPDLIAKAEGAPLADPVLRVNGTHITEFPYTTTFEQTDKIDVVGEGSVPIYVTAYQQIWNETPEAVSTDFSVSSKFMQDGKEVTTLTAGEPVELVVSVVPKANASYVMIDVPIPAGCSYEEHYQNRWGEIHREYFKEKVSIFVRQMNIEQGVYTYTIKLIPRYTGSYTLNPARVELMYFPTFFGRNGIEQLEIIDSK